MTALQFSPVFEGLFSETKDCVRPQSAHYHIKGIIFFAINVILGVYKLCVSSALGYFFIFLRFVKLIVIHHASAAFVFLKNVI